MDEILAEIEISRNLALLAVDGEDPDVLFGIVLVFVPIFSREILCIKYCERGKKNSHSNPTYD